MSLSPVESLRQDLDGLVREVNDRAAAGAPTWEVRMRLEVALRRAREVEDLERRTSALGAALPVMDQGRKNATLSLAVN